MSNTNVRPPKLSDYGITIDDVIAQSARDAVWAVQWRQMVEFTELVHKLRLAEYERQRTKGTGPFLAGLGVCGIIFWICAFVGMRDHNMAFLWLGLGINLAGLVIFSRMSDRRLEKNKATLPPMPELEYPRPPSLDTDPRVQKYCEHMVAYLEAVGRFPASN